MTGQLLSRTHISSLPKEMNAQLFAIVTTSFAVFLLIGSINTVVSFRQARTDPYLILRRASLQRAWLWLLTTLLSSVVFVVLMLLQFAE